MEGWFWRITDREGRRVVLALCGVNRHADGDWATLGIAAHPGGLVRSAAEGRAWASGEVYEVRVGEALVADEQRLRIRLGDTELDVELHDLVGWPHRLGAGGVFAAIPYLGQYWHPHLLGAHVEGHAVLGDRTIDLDGATAYAEKNWGAGFPGRWWWGQAQGFEDPGVCVAFAGGVLERGRLKLSATSVVVHLGDGETLRLVPPLAVTSVDTGASAWRVRARSARHRVTIEGDSGGTEPHLLPVPIPAERRTVNRARQYLAGRMRVEVETGRRLRYRGESLLAGLEVGEET